MNEAIGGSVNVFLILFFILVIALYMAFNINYQKAFNVKNRIIELYEDYDGNCSNNENCYSQIEEYEQNIGYGNIKKSDVNSLCEKAGKNPVGKYGYCHKGIEINNDKEDDVVEEARKTCYFDITTFVEIDIPVVKNLLNLSLFQVNGQTKQLKVKPGASCESLAPTIEGE